VNVRHYLDRVVRDKMNINATCRMTESEYDRERTELLATYGRNASEANGRREQALAILFHRSGWTQEELAKKEGRSQQHIARRESTEREDATCCATPAGFSCCISQVATHHRVT
jgi:hypothetical protein